MARPEVKKLVQKMQRELNVASASNKEESSSDSAMMSDVPSSDDGSRYQNGSLVQTVRMTSVVKHNKKPLK